MYRVIVALLACLPLVSVGIPGCTPTKPNRYRTDLDKLDIATVAVDNFAVSKGTTEYLSVNQLIALVGEPELKVDVPELCDLLGKDSQNDPKYVACLVDRLYFDF